MITSFDIEHYTTALRQLSYASSAFQDSDKRLPHEAIAPVCHALDKCQEPFQKMGLKVSAGMIYKFLDAAERNLPDCDWTGVQFAERCHAVFSAIQCETQGLFWLKVEKPSADYLRGSNEVTQVMRDRFPKAVFEMQESAECLSFERSTASVFHSMRAVEVILKAAWKTLGIVSPKKVDSWGNMIGPMDEELAKKPADRKPAWLSHKEFFAGLIYHLRAAKIRYRDTTMHVEENYTQDEAEAVFNSVLAMVKNASEHLDQDGNFIQ